MDRRTFLKQGMTLSAALMLGSKSTLVQAPAGEATGAWRTFEVITRVEVIDPAGTVRVWLPIPLLEEKDYFMRQPDSYTGNFKSARSVQYDRHGTGLIYAQWDRGEKSPALELKSRFKTRNRQIDLNAKSDASIKEDENVLNYFRRPSKLIKADGIVVDTAREITANQKSDVDIARAIYEWIVEKTYRDPKVRGCGTGDIATMLHTQNLGGKCADLNALFVGLARASGLAARDIYGIRCSSSAEFKSLGRAHDITGAQHCRAEVYLQGYGWVPVDPADVRKVILEENQPEQLALDDPIVKKARAKLFGSWEMNWLPYNYAHDVLLPESRGPEIGFLMYPQSETAKGRKDCLDPKTFKYTITANEI